MWIETTRRIAALPTWVERARALEQLAIEPAVTVDRVIEDTGVDIETGDGLFSIVAAHVLTRVMPATSWVPLFKELVRAEYTIEREALRAALERVPALLPAAIDALDADPFAALQALHQTWQFGDKVPAVLAAAWPRVFALATSTNEEIARKATLLAIRAKQVTPPMIGVLARLLASVDLDDIEGYDEQVAVEELHSMIAGGGTALRELAPALVPYLRCKSMAWRWSAVYAAIGIGAVSLRPEIEAALKKAKKKNAEAEIERSLCEYAIWLFGGDDDALARATAASDNIIAMHRLRVAFEASNVDDRFLTGLRSVATTAALVGHVCEVLAAIGPRAKATVSAIPAPRPADENYTAWVVALYRCGVATAAETRVALEKDLTWHGWKLYAELAVDDARVEQRVRTTLASDSPDLRPCAEAVAAVPALGARLLPLVRERGHVPELDALLYSMWSAGVNIAG